MARSCLAAALMAAIHSKSLRQNGITPVIPAGKSQETRPSRQPTRPRRRRVAATAGSRISGALPRATANSHQTFFHHLPRRRRGQLEMDALSPDPDQSWRIRFHSVRKVTRSLGLQKDIFAPFLCLFENGGCLPAAGGLASVLDVPGGCISVPGWRCRRTCRRLPLRNARQLVNFKRGGGRVSPPRAYVDACDLGKPREIAAPFGGREGVRDYIAARASIAFAQAL
jgi:hypothetical protein